MTGDAVAASIAHEVSQPLTAIVTSAGAGLRLLDREIPNLEKAREAFRRITADGHRASEVVGSIRGIFRNEVRLAAGLDLNEVIHEALALERDSLQTHRITVSVQPGAQLPAVHGDRVQLQHLLLNLIANAIHAMATEDEPRLLSVRSEVYEGTSVMISVADTGAGVRADDAARIFTPLFTTRAEGMGMGLVICRSIVEAHAGRLWTVPNSPRGAIFRFTLPGPVPATSRSM